MLNILFGGEPASDGYWKSGDLRKIYRNKMNLNRLGFAVAFQIEGRRALDRKALERMLSGH
jgi:hypothetical protein